MSYSVAFTDEAQSDLDKLPPTVASALLDRLEVLASSPVTHSVRVHFPYRQVGQLFRCAVDLEGRRWVFNVGFAYGADEQTLYLLYIAVQTIPPL